MRRTTLAKWLVAGALAGAAVVGGASSAFADATAVQGSNSSSDGVAASGAATGGNATTANAGPAATGSGGSMSSQIGNNSTSVNQSASARSGDAVAGSQIVGVVGNGDTTVQQQNSSTDAVATSGDVTVNNNVTANSGPAASTTGTGSSSASQNGDNSIRVVQESVAESGSAVAGSQVGGYVNNGGTVTAQSQNSSDSPVATSGFSEITSVLDINSGPFSSSEDGTSVASQIGDNDAVMTQAARSTTGDAVSGSQVTGYVGSGDATTQNQNTSTTPVAVSGDALTTIVATVNSGPHAESLGTDSASATQNGDNSVASSQQAGSTTGDAVSGSQVTGLVSEQRGHLEVQNQNSSDAPVATSGNVEAIVDLTVIAGPDADPVDGGTAQAAQMGDNEVTADQALHLASGDAVAGAQITGVVGGNARVQNQNTSDSPVALSGLSDGSLTGTVNAGPSATATGDADASASQIGNNSSDLSQSAAATSGDAVSGTQVTGIIGSGRGQITVQNSNDSSDAVAETGEVSVINVADTQAGPAAEAIDGSALATQNGDNDNSVSQEAVAASGDAVSGSQITGIVGGSDVTVQLLNSSTDDVATSGLASAENDATVDAGPLATTNGTTASASQIGDNDIAVSQAASASTGDAVAGSQVAGAVGSAATTIQGTNDSDSSVALASDADSLNTADGMAGPFATSPGTPLATQNGNNTISGAQDAPAASGDALAGAQVFGAA